MRPLLILLLLTATPAQAEGDPKLALLAPDPTCEAPAIVTPASAQPVQDTAAIPPPFRMALFACARGADGPRKPTVRRT